MLTRPVQAPKAAPKTDEATCLLKELMKQHPAFEHMGPRRGDVASVIKTLNTILSKLGGFRDNHAPEENPNGRKRRS